MWTSSTMHISDFSWCYHKSPVKYLKEGLTLPPSVIPPWWGRHGGKRLRRLVMPHLQLGRGRRWTLLSPPSLFYSLWGASPWQSGIHIYCVPFFFNQTSLKISSQTHPEMCSLGDSVFSQVVNENEPSYWGSGERMSCCIKWVTIPFPLSFDSVLQRLNYILTTETHIRTCYMYVVVLLKHQPLPSSHTERGQANHL